MSFTCRIETCYKTHRVSFYQQHTLIHHTFSCYSHISFIKCTNRTQKAPGKGDAKHHVTYIFSEWRRLWPPACVLSRRRSATAATLHPHFGSGGRSVETGGDRCRRRNVALTATLSTGDFTRSFLSKRQVELCGMDFLKWSQPWC